MRRLFKPRRPDDYPAASRRQRLFVALAAVAITVLIGLAILRPQLALMRAKRADVAGKPCAPGQQSGCVGGTMPVTVLPPASASAPSR